MKFDNIINCLQVNKPGDHKECDAEVAHPTVSHTDTQYIYPVVNYNLSRTTLSLPISVELEMFSTAKTLQSPSRMCSPGKNWTIVLEVR